MSISSILEYKICLVGDTGVGKTCVAVRFVSGAFNAYQTSSSSAAFLKKSVMVDNQTIKYQIWDTAGQEAFRSLAPMYYRSAAAILIVFDVTRPKTFENVKYWVGEIKNKANQNVFLYLIANKVDLCDQRAVSHDEAEIYAKQVNADYIECSAQTGYNIDELFQHLGRKKLSIQQEEKQLEIINNPTVQKKKCC